MGSRSTWTGRASPPSTRSGPRRKRKHHFARLWATRAIKRPESPTPTERKKPPAPWHRPWGGRQGLLGQVGRGCRRQEHASSPRLPAGSCALSPQSREPRRDFLNVFTNRPGLNPDGIASINALVSRRRRARKRRHRSPKDPRTWGNQRTRCRCTPKPGSLLRTACQLLGVSCSTLRGNCPALSQAGPRPGGVRAPGLWQDLRSKPAGRLLRWRHEHHPRPG